MSSKGIGSNIDLLGGGEAAGSQAQFAIYLQLFTQLLAAVQTLTPGAASPYIVTPWTTSGALDISTAFPALQTGTISVRQSPAAPVNVTLPAAGGPWIILDGAGVAAADNITVLAPGGLTINGGASKVINTNWGGLLCTLDGTNYIASVL